MFSHSPVPAALRAAAVVVLLQVQAPAIAGAGPNQEAAFLVHLTDPVAKNPCGLASNPPGCSGINDRGLIDRDYYAYVIVGNLHAGAGLYGARFGIAYDGAPESGVDVYSWTRCSDGLDFPVAGWPDAGGGNYVAWLDCHTVSDEGMAVAGYFFLLAYGPDEIQVTPHPLLGTSVSDCLINEDVITMGVRNPFGWATFSADASTGGSSPCGLDNGSCHISGPTGVDMGQTGIVYTMRPDEVLPTGVWLVGGNAVTTSSDPASVTVTATDPGTFTIQYHRSSDCVVVDGCGCRLTVQVYGPIRARPATWGRLKARLGGSGG
jgi:hypothetical protein